MNKIKFKGHLLWAGDQKIAKISSWWDSKRWLWVRIFRTNRLLYPFQRL